jgi:hypothetical protein
LRGEFATFEYPDLLQAEQALAFFSELNQPRGSSPNDVRSPTTAISPGGDMTNDLILNLFLAGFVVVFAAIGFVRGVQREVFVTAAILGGWAMASAWSQRWGAELADLVNISAKTAGFIVTMGLLVGSLIILGWGGSNAIGSRASGSGERIAGAILGGVNGVLLASYSLTAYTRYLSDAGDRELISTSRLAHLARDEYGYVLAIGMGAMVLLALIGLAIGGKPERPPMPQGRSYPTPTASYRNDDAKVEPVRTNSQSYLDTTMPIAPVEPNRNAENGGKRQQTRFRPGATCEWSRVPANELTAPINVASADSYEAAATVSCRACGQQVSLVDVYCPYCGKLTR